jgi:hypothetical protein
MPACTAVYSAVAALPDLIEALTNGRTAAQSAAGSAASARRALLAADHELAAARVQRAERLLTVATSEQTCAARLLAAILAGLHPQNQAQRVHVAESSSNARKQARGGDWDTLSDSWWEEKLIGLRWRLAAIGDSLHVIGRVASMPQQESDYAASVRDVAELWSTLHDDASISLSWIEEWRELALQAGDKVIGLAGILVDSP